MNFKSPKSFILGMALLGLVAGFVSDARAATVTAPTLTITEPKNNAKWSNDFYTVTGTIKAGTHAVSNVWVSVNSGSWNTAGISNTTWNLQIGLTPGTNIIAAYATDIDNDNSKTNTVKLLYVVHMPFALTITGGLGKVTGASNNEELDENVNYTLDAKADKGFAFEYWSGDVAMTTNAKIAITMVPGLAVIANFKDITPPTLAVTAPKASEKYSNSTITVTGTAADNYGLGAVYVQINDGGWNQADGTTNWTIEGLPVRIETNTVQAYAVDDAGNVSKTNTVTFTGFTPPPALSTFSIVTASEMHNPQSHIAFDGNNILSVFQVGPSGNTTAGAQFFSPAGSLVGSQLSLNPGGSDDPPTVAFDGANYLAAWADYSQTQSGVPVKGAFVSPDGSVGGVIQLSQSETVDNFSTIVYGDGMYFIEWGDARTSPDSVYGALVDTSGNQVSGDFLISTNGRLEEAGQTSAAFDGTHFLAAWSNASGKTGVNVQLIDTAGNLVGSPLVIYTNTVSTDLGLPDVVFDGTNYLILYNTGAGTSSSASGFHVAGQFVTTSGTLQGGAFTVTSDAGPQIVASGAFDGTNYLITWNQGSDPFASGNKSATINARLFDTQGNPADSEFPVLTTTGKVMPLFASDLWDGTNFVVTAGLGTQTAAAPNLSFTNGAIGGAIVSP